MHTPLPDEFKPSRLSANEFAKRMFPESSQTTIAECMALNTASILDNSLASLLFFLRRLAMDDGSPESGILPNSLG